MADARDFVSDITNLAVGQIEVGPKLSSKRLLFRDRESRSSYLERETGLACPPQEGTRDPLLGKIKFRDSYLAEPNFHDL
jgi:hypothetical protein